jgi:sulfotransferase family protein
MAAELERDPIVVYGAPRSGTTYLEQVLNSHPEVFISHETRVFAWLHHAMKLTQDHRLVANQQEPFVEHLRSVFPEVMRDFYRQLAPPGARHWGDKNPHYADPFNHGTLDLVAELFPASRFIHIIRDGRDVVSSLTRKRWKEDKPWVTFEEAHFTWKKHVRFGRTFGESLPPTRYFELRYEDLIANDAAVAGEIFGFLGIDLDPAVEEFCRAQQASRTPFKDPMRDFGNGISASDWPRIFSLEEQARSLELIGRPLVRYGYETEESLAELRRKTAEALAAANDRESATSARSADA